MKYYCTVNGTEHEVVLQERLGELNVTVDGKAVAFRYEEADTHGQVVLDWNGDSFAISIEGDTSEVDITLAGYDYHVDVEDERERAARAAAKERSAGGGPVNAVMPGMVVKVLVEPGEAVTKGQALLTLEAMKMQNEIGAPADGVVQTVHVKENEAVGAGTKLVTLGPPPAE